MKPDSIYASAKCHLRCNKVALLPLFSYSYLLLFWPFIRNIILIFSIKRNWPTQYCKSLMISINYKLWMCKYCRAKIFLVCTEMVPLLIRNQICKKESLIRLSEESVATSVSPMHTMRKNSKECVRKLYWVKLKDLS